MTLNEIGVVRLASHCSAKWEDMVGDERVRLCGSCDKNVFHLNEMKAEEVRALIVGTEGKFCGRFFTRRDGTILTKDCPVGLRRAKQKLAFAWAAALVVLFGGAASVLKAVGFWDAACELGAKSAQQRGVVEQLKQRLPIKAAQPQPIYAAGGMG